MKNRKKLSAVSSFHFFRLFYRSALLLGFIGLYIYHRVNNLPPLLGTVEKEPLLLVFIWIIFMFEMICRFFPSKIESPGCQKQFAKNYIPTGCTEPVLHDNNGVVLVALIWIIFNAIFGALYLSHVFDDEIMMIISLTYSVCDMICILFFCPFQTLFLKNKCCSACRIYNWDYAMMFTPLFFVRKTYTWSLLIVSVILLLKWEITVYMYPERFSENTNAYLNCSNCTEKLCHHKKQLAKFKKQLKLEKIISEARILLKNNTTK